jgi:hypothetical protein
VNLVMHQRSGAKVHARFALSAPPMGCTSTVLKTPASPFDRWTTLRDDIEQLRLDFIRTDLGVCITFATVAETAYRMGHWEHAERTLASAEQGYSTLLRFFSKAKRLTQGTEQELQSKFKHLRERLDWLQRLR